MGYVLLHIHSKSWKRQKYKRQKKTKTKKAETQKDNNNNKRFNIDMSGQFHNLVMLLKRRQGSHLPGILDHPSQQVQLQPLHVDQLLRSHAPDVWLGELPFFNPFFNDQKSQKLVLHFNF